MALWKCCSLSVVPESVKELSLCCVLYEQMTGALPGQFEGKLLSFVDMQLLYYSSHSESRSSFAHFFLLCIAGFVETPAAWRHQGWWRPAHKGSSLSGAGGERQLRSAYALLQVQFNTLMGKVGCDNLPCYQKRTKPYLINSQLVLAIGPNLCSKCLQLTLTSQTQRCCMNL